MPVTLKNTVFYLVNVPAAVLVGGHSFSTTTVLWAVFDYDLPSVDEEIGVQRS